MYILINRIGNEIYEVQDSNIEKQVPNKSKKEVNSSGRNNKRVQYVWKPFRIFSAAFIGLTDAAISVKYYLIKLMSDMPEKWADE